MVRSHCASIACRTTLVVMLGAAAAGCHIGPHLDSDRGLGEAWQARRVPPPYQDGLSTPNVALMSADNVWALLEQSDPQSHRAIVHFKRPDANRGFFRGKSLLSERDAARFRERLVQEVAEVRDLTSTFPPIRTTSGARLPTAVVSVPSEEGLRALLRTAYVSFVEPAFVPLKLEDSLGCGADVYSPPENNSFAIDHTWNAQGDFLQEVSPRAGDVVPYAYGFHRVPETWRAVPRPGEHEFIAVLDTGISKDQMQFFSRYAAVIPREPLVSINRTSEDPNDVCFHGTKVAALAAAPRDYLNVVGVAFAAPLTVVKVDHNPFTSHSYVGAICAGITDAVMPSSPRLPARAVAMAFGLSYASPTITDCITTAFTMSPTTVFVAAGGTQEPVVPFPANLKPLVQAVSVVLVGPDGRFRLAGAAEGLAYTPVGYGPAIDYVTVFADDKGFTHAPLPIPSAGVVGDGTSIFGYGTEEISEAGFSSAATGVYTGIVAAAGQYATARQWTRAQLLTALSLSASTANIFGDPVVFGNNPIPPHSMAGTGVVDLYRATGGARAVSIEGPDSAIPGSRVVLSAVPDVIDSGVVPNAPIPGHFVYTWSINDRVVARGQTVAVVAPTTGKTFDLVVEATDTRDDRRFFNSKAVDLVSTIAPPTVRTLYWTSYVEHHASFFNGGRYDDDVNLALSMEPGCSVRAVSGLHLCNVNGSVRTCRGASPHATDDVGNGGFVVTRVPGSLSNNLAAHVHSWHDGLSSIRTNVVYTVFQPAGADCAASSLGVLSPSAP